MAKAIGTLTNALRIRLMNDEKLADFIRSIHYDSKAPWDEEFERKFCDSCPSLICTVEGYKRPLELHECNFADGECPHGDPLLWWLGEVAKEK